MIRIDRTENLSSPARPETNEALVNLTLEVWQPLYQRQLSREDARQIAENPTGFFRVLLRCGCCCSITELVLEKTQRLMT